MNNITFVLIEFYDYDELRSFPYYTKRDNSYLPQFEKIFAKAIVQAIDFKQLNEFFEIEKKITGFEIAYLLDVVDFEKVDKYLEKYGFYPIKYEQVISISSQTTIDKNLKVHSKSRKPIIDLIETELKFLRDTDDLNITSKGGSNGQKTNQE